MSYRPASLLRRLTLCTVLSNTFCGGEKHPRAEKCVSDELRAKRSKDAGLPNSSAIREVEDAAPRSFVVGTPRGRAYKRGLVGCVLVAMGLLLPTAAQAVPIYRLTALPSTTEAGGHPDIAFSYAIGNREQFLSTCACNDSKDIALQLPTGLIGNPHATPQCPLAAFAAEECPVDSQIGIAQVEVSDDGSGNGGSECQNPEEECKLGFITGVYALVPPPGDAGLLGSKTGIFNSPILTVISSRTSTDYGLEARIANIAHFLPISSTKQVLWGVPAEPIHDYLRFGFREVPLIGVEHFCTENAEQSTYDPTTIRTVCIQPGDHRSVGSFLFEGGPGGPVPSDSPPTPFWQNPTTCGASLVTSLDVLTYSEEFSEASSSYPSTTDCEQLTFNPSQSVAPTTSSADSPSGAALRLTVPQFESPTVPSPSELRAVTVTFPEGFSLAPNAANGKSTCSDAQAAFGTTEEAQCPEDAKVGTISIDTPVLPAPLPGAVYLGAPLPGNRFRIFLVLNGFGLHIKLPGTITPDPKTGRLTIGFQNLPQTPFETFDVHIFGSESGALDTPTQCGSYKVSSTFTPWDAALPAETSEQFFKITEGPNDTPCPGGARPFSPAFTAASASNTSAAHTSFSLDLARADGEQNLDALNVTAPPGFSATLKGVSYCPQAAIQSAESESHTGLEEQAIPSCPASSQVGEFTAGAGPGSHPLYLPGKVYLAGPYKGAPLSFVFITPAVAGGYDLGNVVLRTALRIDPETAQVTAVSDPLPQIFQGIPLRLRRVLVDLNRPGFALNPTNCSPFSVKAEVLGTEGAVSNLSNHFQVANCASLPFAPKLTMGFSGSTKQAGNPAVHADISYPAAGLYANVARAVVTLPPTDLVDNAHINTPCTKVQFAAGKIPGEKCPPGSVIGFAKATTPLLEKPLEGPVYLRTHPGVGLPNLVAALNGQIDIALVGKVDTVNNRIRTTFESVPDAPVSNFSLTLDGGDKGLLENKPKFCAHPLHVTADITGQNGKTANQSPVLSTPCGKRHKRKASVHHNRRASR